MPGIISVELLQAIAQTQDLQLSSDAAKALAPDVEYKLRELIQDAQRFARHSRRTRLTTEDVNNALRLRNAECMYGFSSKDPARFVRSGEQEVYALLDRDVPVEQLVEAPLPRPPLEVGVVPHWLLIDGLQPLIPENTPLERTAGKRGRAPPTVPQPVDGRPGQQLQQDTGSALKNQAQTASDASADAQPVQIGMPVQHALSMELQLYFTKAMEAVQAALTATKAGTHSGFGSSGTGPGGAALWGERGAVMTGFAPASNGHANGPLGVVPAAGAGLVVEAKLAAVLASLSSDPGLHGLTPYLVKYLADEVAASLAHSASLLLLLRVARACLRNASALGLAGYVHQLLPALLTCVVAKGLGGSDSPGSTPDHWAVRQAAAAAVAEVCAQFGGEHLNLQPRVARTLLRALLDSTKPLATHYGAVVGLAALGPTAVRLLLLPQLPAYCARLQPLLGDREGPEQDLQGLAPMQLDGPAGGTDTQGGAWSASRSDAIRVHGAVVDATATALCEALLSRAGSVLPDEALAAARPHSSVLAQVAQSLASQAPSIAAQGVDSDRSLAVATLAAAWQEDSDSGRLAWAAVQILGRALAARLPEGALLPSSNI